MYIFILRIFEIVEEVTHGKCAKIELLNNHG